ncbi:MAG: hypothetical protein KGH49_01090 [Candidatus Micrarchaeota archaeon]|nr:hypothetical protein [Candidatus Micrarchaeota archaeon]
MVYVKNPREKENAGSDKKLSGILSLAASGLSAGLLVVDGIVRGPSYENWGELSIALILALRGNADLQSAKKKFAWSDKK